MLQVLHVHSKWILIYFVRSTYSPSLPNTSMQPLPASELSFPTGQPKKQISKRSSAHDLYPKNIRRYQNQILGLDILWLLIQLSHFVRSRAHGSVHLLEATFGCKTKLNGQCDFCICFVKRPVRKTNVWSDKFFEFLGAIGWSSLAA